MSSNYTKHIKAVKQHNKSHISVYTGRTLRACLHEALEDGITKAPVFAKSTNVGGVVLWTVEFDDVANYF